MKKIAVILLSILAGITIPATLNAQLYTFKHLKIEDGLPNNTILNCMQDRLGFIWICTKDGISRYDGAGFKTFDTEAYRLMSGKAYALCEDSDGDIWFSTSMGNGYYNPNTDEITEVESDGEPVYCICSDDSKNIWFCSISSITRYDRVSGEVTKYPVSLNRNVQMCTSNTDGDIWFAQAGSDLLHYSDFTGTFDSLSILSDKDKENGVMPVNLTQLGDGRLLVTTTDNRILRVNPHNRTVETVTSMPEDIWINCILAKSPDEYWIGCLQGLYIYREKEGIITHIDGSEAHSLSNNNITCMTFDNEGNIWLGTFHGGMNFCFNSNNRINQFYSHSETNSINGNIVRTICEDPKGNIWIGTEDSGLTKLFPKKNRSQDIHALNRLPILNYQSSILVGNDIWMATYGSGVYVFDTTSDLVKSIKAIPGSTCVCIQKASDGSIYAGGSAGLMRYDPDQDTFVIDNSLEGLFVHTLFEDSYQTLWAGAYGEGLWFRKKGESSFTRIPDSDYSAGLKSGFITNIFEDGAHRLYVATEGAGVAVTQLGQDPSFSYITKENGLPSNIGCAITQDKSGKIWISSSRGLVQYNPEYGAIEKAYLDDSGIVGNSFCYGACHQTPEGYIYMGTYSGMIEFDPGILIDYTENAPLYITDIICSNGQEEKKLTAKGKSALMSDVVTVKKKDASILTINFASLCYSNLSELRYEYSMSRNAPKSGTITSENSVTYSALRAGKYTFKVRILGSSSPESEKTVQIRILPPFPLSKPALGLYLLIILGILIWIFAQLNKKQKNKEALNLAKLETNKQKEIYDAKINFFTNITHEIRTPLSLIKMPIEKIIAEKDYTESSKDDIFTIQANTNRLLNLTNQLLDLKKIEKREIILNLQDVDICKFAKKVSEYFTPAVRERHIDYTVDIPDETWKIHSDTDFIEKILCNLLSNAVKYGKDAICMQMEKRESDDNIVIKVKSNGDRISSSEAKNIFKPFYQIKTVSSHLIGSNGTGLGLPYARNLATALGGRLYLDSEDSEWNSFVVEIPMNPAGDPVEIFEGQEVEMEAAKESNRHSVLVVEDSLEMNKYLCKELGKDYNILSAANGEEAVKIVSEEKVDLIVSDIMMPVMDGCQLCNHIKKSLEYSHIPVILLTAAVGVETRIETLEVGADGYIEKPFSIDLLKANVSNLFKNREIANNQFANSPLSHFNSTVVNNIDQDFMDKLHNAVMDNIADQNLGIDALTSIMLTSKSTLYRKVKANTGLNINEYIRICRLKKAAELLSTLKHRINEVAYLTGFSSPSYFATSFQKQFQISPSTFVKNLGGKS